MLPLGTNRAASLPTMAAARASSFFTVGSSPKTSSPTSASAIAWRMAGVGCVTVSERKSMRVRFDFSVVGKDVYMVAVGVFNVSPRRFCGDRTPVRVSVGVRLIAHKGGGRQGARRGRGRSRGRGNVGAGQFGDQRRDHG